jgi:hypothetical protein
MHIKLGGGVVAFNRDGQPQTVAEDEDFKQMESQLSEALAPMMYDVVHLKDQAASSQNLILRCDNGD